MVDADSCEFVVVNVTNAIGHGCSVIRINDTVDANGNTPGSIDQRKGIDTTENINYEWIPLF